MHACTVFFSISFFLQFLIIIIFRLTFSITWNITDTFGKLRSAVELLPEDYNITSTSISLTTASIQQPNIDLNTQRILRINSAGSFDSGIVQCIATNSYGRATAQSFVTINGKLFFIL